MARLPRVVAVDIPHHVTQRGNARQVVFSQDADRITYLELLRQYAELYSLSVLGYCLMSNHAHLIVLPRTEAAMANTLKHTHGRYATYWNARRFSAAMFGRGDSIPVRWMTPIFGRPYGMPNSIRYALAWSLRLNNGNGPALRPTARMIRKPGWR